MKVVVSDDEDEDGPRDAASRQDVNIHLLFHSHKSFPMEIFRFKNWFPLAKMKKSIMMRS